MAAGHGCCAGLWLGRSGCTSEEGPRGHRHGSGAGFIQKMQEVNGAFNDPKARESARNGYAMTALGLLSLASIGHQPSDPGKIGASMGRALDFILRNDPRRGEYEYFGSDGSRCTATALPPCA